MPETTKYFSSFRTQILSTENEDNMEFKKTTCGFTKNDRLFYQKRRVVLHKTTSCFYSIDVSFFLHLLLPLSHRWEKTRTDAPTRRKNTVLFYPFCKTHLSKFVQKPQKTVYFTPKMGQKGAFFPFSLIFRTNIEKKQ